MDIARQLHIYFPSSPTKPRMELQEDCIVAMDQQLSPIQQLAEDLPVTGAVGEYFSALQQIINENHSMANDHATEFNQINQSNKEDIDNGPVCSKPSTDCHVMQRAVTELQGSLGPVSAARGH